MSIEIRESDGAKMSEEMLREEFKETVKKNQVLERNLSDLHFEFEKLRGCIEKFKEERYNLVTNVSNFNYIESWAKEFSKAVSSEGIEEPSIYANTEKLLIWCSEIYYERTLSNKE